MLCCSDSNIYLEVNINYFPFFFFPLGSLEYTGLHVSLTVKGSGFESQFMLSCVAFSGSPCNCMGFFVVVFFFLGTHLSPKGSWDCLQLARDPNEDT